MAGNLMEKSHLAFDPYFKVKLPYSKDITGI